MELADGFGGYRGITNWTAFRVPDMWAMVSAVQPDVHWKHVAGWRKMYELTWEHLTRLRRYRERLVEVWPPEKNAAAQAYVSRLDHLIATVEQTFDTASNNYTVLSATTGALSSAQTELRKIYEEYAAKAQQKQHWDREVADLAAVGFTGAAANKPPVTQQELDQLDSRARTVMFSLSGELAQAQVQIRQPPRYQRADVTPDPEGASESASSAAFIPPITAVPTPSADQLSARGAQQISLSPVPAPTAPGLGPVLGSAGTLTPQAPPINTGTIAPPSTPIAAGASFAPPVPPAGIPPSAGAAARPSLGSGASPVKPGIGATPAQPRVLPPGGMIGGLPGNGLGQPAGGASGARKINPVGGVIGGSSAGTAPVGATGQRPNTGGGRLSAGSSANVMGQHMGAAPSGRSPRTGLGGFSNIDNMAGQAARTTGIVGSQPLGTMPSNRTNVHNSEERARQWDPDNPWEVDEGVSPVVLPPSELDRIDPGPAIGLGR